MSARMCVSVSVTRFASVGTETTRQQREQKSTIWYWTVFILTLIRTYTHTNTSSLRSIATLTCYYCNNEPSVWMWLWMASPSSSLWVSLLWWIGSLFTKCYLDINCVDGVMRVGDDLCAQMTITNTFLNCRQCWILAETCPIFSSRQKRKKYFRFVVRIFSRFFPSALFYQLYFVATHERFTGNISNIE